MTTKKGKKNSNLNQPKNLRRNVCNGSMKLTHAFFLCAQTCVWCPTERWSENEMGEKWNNKGCAQSEMSAGAMWLSEFFRMDFSACMRTPHCFLVVPVWANVCVCFHLNLLLLLWLLTLCFSVAGFLFGFRHQKRRTRICMAVYLSDKHTVHMHTAQHISFSSIQYVMYSIHEMHASFSTHEETSQRADVRVCGTWPLSVYSDRYH